MGPLFLGLLFFHEPVAKRCGNHFPGIYLQVFADFKIVRDCQWLEACFISPYAFNAATQENRHIELAYSVLLPCRL